MRRDSTPLVTNLQRAATPELVTATAQRVYADYPEILRALGLAG
jgi:hypothetical protein